MLLFNKSYKSKIKDIEIKNKIKSNFTKSIPEIIKNVFFFLFLFKVLSFVSASCRSVPLSINNITSCTGELCSAQIETNIVIDLRHGSESCLSFEGDSRSSGGQLLQSVKIQVAESVLRYRLTHLYDSGDAHVSTNTECKCPYDNGALSLSGCIDSPDICVGKNGFGYHGADFIPLLDIFKTISNLASRQCLSSGTARYRTQSSLFMKKNVAVFKQLSSSHDISLNIIEVLSNNSTKETYRHWSTDKNFEISLGDLSISSIFISGDNLPVLSGAIVEDRDFPGALKLVSAFNEVGVYDTTKPGWFQYVDGKGYSDEAEVSNRIKTSLVNCNGARIATTTTLPSWKGVLDSTNDLEKVLQSDYIFYDSVNQKASETFANRKGYSAEKITQFTDSHLPGQTSRRVAYDDEVPIVVNGVMDGVMKLKGYTGGGYLIMSWHDLKFDIDRESESFDVRRCESDTEVTSTRVWIYKCHSGYKMCIRNVLTVPINAEQTMMTDVAGNADEQFVNLLTPEGICRKVIYSISDQRFFFNMKRHQNQIILNSDKLINGIIKISGTLNNIRFHQDRVCPKVSSCHYDKELGKITMFANSDCGKGDSLLVSNDSTVVVSRNVGLLDAVKPFDFFTGKHDENLNMKLGLCYKEDCSYCSAFLNKIISNPTTNSVTKEIPIISHLMDIIYHPSMNTGGISSYVAYIYVALIVLAIVIAYILSWVIGIYLGYWLMTALGLDYLIYQVYCTITPYMVQKIVYSVLKTIMSMVGKDVNKVFPFFVDGQMNGIGGVGVNIGLEKESKLKRL